MDKKLNNCENFNFCLLKSLFDNIDLYSVLVDKSGEIIYGSRKFRNYFFDNIIGKKLSEIISYPAYEEVRKTMLEVIFTNKNLEKNILFLDNQSYRIYFVPITNKESQVSHIIMLAINASVTKKLEIENEKLKKDLEESNSIKSIFLSNISHELKTPMSAIIGFSELLLGPNNQTEKFLKSINSNAKYLNELLDNILDYSKIESNEFDILYENFSLNELFDELFEILEVVNYKKNLDIVKLKFIKGEDKKIISDYLRLKQVLFNIISNAIKFTESGSIEVKFEETDNSILFTIKDTGIGIEEDKIKFIFNRFWQYDSSSTKTHRGVGLGLSISKSIIEMLNGAIWVESKLGKGSTFFVKIPLEQIKHDLVVIKNKEKLNFSDKKVLIVDEVPINYSLVSIYLNSLDVKMILTHNGKEAIKIYKKQKEKIDLVFLDINLLEMDGFELAKNLKEINPNCIIFSKSGTDIEPNEYIYAHLKKPFSKDKLITLLKELWLK